MYCVVPKTDAGIFLWEDSPPASTAHAGLVPMLAVEWEKRKSGEKAPDAISAGRPLAAKLQIDPLGASGMLSPVPRKRSSAVFQLMTCQMFST